MCKRHQCIVGLTLFACTAFLWSTSTYYQNPDMLIQTNAQSNKPSKQASDNKMAVSRQREQFPDLDIGWHKLYDVLTIHDKPVIWIFWDNNTVPPIIEMCQSAIKCHNEPFVHLQMIREYELAKWVSNVHPAYPFLIPAHKADYFRARILDEYGGIYLDSDAIALGSTQSMFDKLRWYDLVSYMWTSDGDPISIGTLGPMRSHLPFTARWVTQLHYKLDQKLPALRAHKKNASASKYPLQWAEICRNIVKEEMTKQILPADKATIKYFSINGETTVGQAVGSFSQQLQDNTNVRVTQTPYLFWHHSAFAHISDKWKSVDEILSENYVLVELLAMSFKECQVRSSDTLKYDSVMQPRQFLVKKTDAKWTKDDADLRSWIRNKMDTQNGTVT